MAAQTAVAFIRKGTEMLHLGRMELEGVKKTAEQVIGDVKAIKGIFDWFISLFVSKPAKPDDTPKPVAKAKAAAKRRSYGELELKLIKDIGDSLGVLFDTQQAITNHYIELEETSKTKYDPTQNTSKKAIERALIELQMEKLMLDVRQAMVYAPAELKDLYGRFLKMYARIEQEQAWARTEMIRRARLARWKQEQEEIRFIELVSGVVAIMFVFVVFGWLMWRLQDLSDGF